MKKKRKTAWWTMRSNVLDSKALTVKDKQPAHRGVERRERERECVCVCVCVCE